MKIMQVKKSGRKAIKGNVLKSSVFILLFAVNMTAFSSLPFFIDRFFSYNRIISAALLILVFAVGMIVFSSLKSGSRAWFLFYDKNKRGVKTAYWFRPSMLLRSFHLYFSLFIRKFFWSFLFFLPSVMLIAGAVIVAYNGGVEFNLFATWIAGGAALALSSFVFLSVFLQRFFLVPYLRVLFPSMKHKELFRKSREYMSENIKKVFLMKLSFVPLFLLCLTVFPSFYIIGYYNQCCAVFAEKIYQASQPEINYQN